MDTNYIEYIENHKISYYKYNMKYIGGKGDNQQEQKKGCQGQKEQKVNKVQQKTCEKKVELPAGSVVHGVPDYLTHRYLPDCHRQGQLFRIDQLLKQGKKNLDKIITVGGWVKQIRQAQKDTLVFISLSDGTTIHNLQIVVSDTISNFSEVLVSGISFSMRITGKIVESPGSEQPIEMAVNDDKLHKVQIFGTNQKAEYPLQAKGMKVETLRDIQHLRVRSNIIGSVTRIRNALSYATHIFFQSRGFNYIHTPIVTTSDCEGAGEMFQVTTILPEKNKPIDQVPVIPNTKLIDYSKDFFKLPAFLTVSGQLNVECFACGLTNVYTFGPTFRAEKSFTSRHLAEFWMVEPEIAFATIHDNMELASDYLKFSIRYLLENYLDELTFFEQRVKKGLIEYLKGIESAGFQKKSYTEVIDILTEHVKSKKVKFEVNEIVWGMDLGSEHERYICEKVFYGPVVVYNYPKELKAFYMKQNEDGKTVAAMDVLVPGVGEIIGGSEREADLDKLDKAIAAKGLDKEGYWWYRDLRKFGTVPHAGFGLGFERLIMLCTGIENIRDVIPFPRFCGTAKF